MPFGKNIIYFFQLVKNTTTPILFLLPISLAYCHGFLYVHSCYWASKAYIFRVTGVGLGVQMFFYLDFLQKYIVVYV